MSPEYVWKLDVEYPAEAFHPDDAPEYLAGQLRGDWAPANWHPDDEYLARFKTDLFVWPVVKRYYVHRSTAVDRANLLEGYGAKVRLLRSAPMEFEERPYKRPLRVIQGGIA